MIYLRVSRNVGRKPFAVAQQLIPVRSASVARFQALAIVTSIAISQKWAAGYLSSLERVIKPRG